MLKTCVDCNIEKDISEFYKHKDMLDGYLNKCKTCVKKRISNHRIKNIEQIRAYDRKRGRLEYRLEANRFRNKSRNMTEEQKELSRLSNIKWQEKNKIKRSCHIILNNAVKYKKITKPNKCSECGCDGVIQGHHEDYEKPLDVLWLCQVCHKKLHRKYKD